MYQWRTDGLISWRDGNYNSNPDLPLSESTTQWDDLYTQFSGSWSLFGIVKEILDLIAAIPTGRYWLNPVLDSTILDPGGLTPSDGDRYLLDGVGKAGSDWDGHSNCIAEYDTDHWVFYEDGGTPPYNLEDGASTWDETNNTYWVFNNDPSPEWIQCGGTTLEKVIRISTVGAYAIDGMKDRGAIFICDASGSSAIELPAYASGLHYRFIKTSTPGANHVDISVKSGLPEMMKVSSQNLVLDTSDPLIPEQEYRAIRLLQQNDYVDIVAAYGAWHIIANHAVIGDQSPTHNGTATGGTDVFRMNLAAGASAIDDDYRGRLIYITAGTNKGQIRQITDYVGSSKEVTVYPGFVNVPDATSVYEMVEYGALYAGVSEIGTCYLSNADKDAFYAPNHMFTTKNFPTLSRVSGLNETETWGALLLGRSLRALAGAKFATAFGEFGRVRWDNQMLFGNLPVESIQGATLTPGLCQVSRIIFGEYVATGDHELLLGTGKGETAFVTEAGKAYYVTYWIAASTYVQGNPRFISWSGSFVVLSSINAPPSLSILAGSENQVETGVLNLPAVPGGEELVLQPAVSGANIRFVASNEFANNNAQFIGFADVIEMDYYDPIA